MAYEAVRGLPQNNINIFNTEISKVIKWFV